MTLGQLMEAVTMYFQLRFLKLFTMGFHRLERGLFLLVLIKIN
jgi:hypothetical protein